MLLSSVLITFLFQAFVVSAESGPCPAYKAMQNFNISKGNSPWSLYAVYEANSAGKPETKCGHNTFEIQLDQTIVTSFRGISTKNPRQPIAINATALLPIGEKPGVFDFNYQENYVFLGALNNASEKKFYILDTDYMTYLISISCVGDGATWHLPLASVSYKQVTPPADLLEKSKKILQSAGFDPALIVAIDQNNCLK